MYVITPECQKNRSICVKSSNLAFKGQKVVLPLFALLIPSYSAEIRYRTFIWHTAWHSRRLSSKWHLIGLPPHVQCVRVITRPELDPTRSKESKIPDPYPTRIFQETNYPTRPEPGFFETDPQKFYFSRGMISKSINFGLKSLFDITPV